MLCLENYAVVDVYPSDSTVRCVGLPADAVAMAASHGMDQHLRIRRHSGAGHPAVPAGAATAQRGDGMERIFLRRCVERVDGCCSSRQCRSPRRSMPDAIFAVTSPPDW